MFVSQGKSLLQQLLRREVTLLWPGPTLLSVLVELIIYVKDQCVLPLLYRPWHYPLLFLKFVLKHDKLHHL